VFAYFIEPNKQITSKLLKVKGNRVETKGPGGDPEAYVVAPEKAMWKHWPDGVPNFIKEPMPAMIYVRNRAEPIDPFNRKSLVTAASLRYMLDEGMLKQTWKEAKEAAGLKGAQGKEILPIILIGIALLLLIVSIYLAWSTSGDVSDLKHMMEGM
jgi:hypothetical protein